MGMYKLLLICLLPVLCFGQPPTRYLLHRYVSGGFTPPTANCFGNYDASVSSSITQVAGKVSQWNDLNGSGRNFIQGTLGNRPSISGNIISFDRTFTQFMSITSTLNQPVTIYIVLRQDIWSMNDGILDGIANNSMLLRQHTSTPNIAQYAGSFGTDNGNVTVSVFKLVTLIYDGANSTISVNNVAGATSNVGTASPGGIEIGAGSGLGSLPSSISIEQTIIYTVHDNLTAQTNMWNYLQPKWSL